MLLNIYRNLISFAIFAGILTRSESFQITCEAPLQETCTVIFSDEISTSDDVITIVGSEFDITTYPTVTGFYAISDNITMKFIPSNLFKVFPQLQYFYLNDVKLQELPSDSFKKCAKLQRMSLQKNLIKSLGQGFAMGCGEVYNLDLSYNQITELNGNSFKGLSSLTTLSLSFNLIEVINKGTFDLMTNLTLIALHMNKIAFVHPSAFLSLPNLNSLVLSNNNIKVIKSGWFSNKTFFSIVNLMDNDIVAVDPDIFKVWLTENSNEINNKIYYHLNVGGNRCIDHDMKEINEATSIYFSNSLRKCFDEYENNYFYRNFP